MKPALNTFRDEGQLTFPFLTPADPLARTDAATLSNHEIALELRLVADLGFLSEASSRVLIEAARRLAGEKGVAQGQLGV